MGQKQHMVAANIEAQIVKADATSDQVLAKTAHYGRFVDTSISRGLKVRHEFESNALQAIKYAHTAEKAAQLAKKDLAELQDAIKEMSTKVALEAYAHMTREKKATKSLLAQLPIKDQPIRLLNELMPCGHS